MNLILVLGALSVSIVFFELLDGLFTRPASLNRKLQGLVEQPGEVVQRRYSTWHAILILLFPRYFHLEKEQDRQDIVDLLRRAGYPYQTTGEFFVAAIHTFSIHLLVGGLAAGLLMAFNAGLALALVLAAVLIVSGLRRPYSRLHTLIKRRAAAVNTNMLTGLAMLNALLSAGVGVQESLRRSANVGGPFCNLLGLLVAQIEITTFVKAIETVEAHLPDPRDVEAGLFFRSVRAFYNNNRPLLPGVQGLQVAVQREVIEQTEKRAALVRQRSGLFGVLAVLGLVISIIAPFVNVIT